MEGTPSPRREVGLEGREEGKEEKGFGGEGLGKGGMGKKTRSQKQRGERRRRRGGGVAAAAGREAGGGRGCVRGSHGRSCPPRQPPSPPRCAGCRKPPRRCFCCQGLREERRSPAAAALSHCSPLSGRGARLPGAPPALPMRGPRDHRSFQPGAARR